MPVLGLDTSTRTQSVALASGGEIVSHAGLKIAGTHSESIVRAVDLVLSTAGLSLADLSAVAVTSGPGSFTGLRIGMATAKGLSLAAGVPLAGFSTLEVLASALASTVDRDPPFRVCALLEAGRGQLYRGYFLMEREPSGNVLPEALEAERVCAPEDALAGIDPESVVGGDGAVNHRDRLLSSVPWTLSPRPAPFLAPSLALRAESILASGRLAARPLVPNYVRPPDALEKDHP